ncbi:MAG: hypothetical protein ACREDE_05605 [Thermoplasmata archaeon]
MGDPVAAEQQRGDRRVAAFGLLLLIDFVLAVVMLATDKNLQTDFGGQSPYYLHWYGVLAMAILNLLVGIGLIAYAAVPKLKAMSPSARRGVGIGALAWTVIAILAMLSIVATYSQVGFSNAMQFAQYLFGVTPYPNVQSYIPWLYDLLLAAYVLTAVVGALALRRTASVRTPSSTS